MTETQTPIDHALPPPPRAITPRVRRRSWHERPVRLWMILTAVITLSTAYFAFRDIRGALIERRLVYHGQTVPAKVEMIDQYDRKEREFDLKDAHQLYLRYTTPAGRSVTTDLPQPPKDRGSIRVGDIIDLRIDPEDPLTATLQTQPRSWSAALAVVGLLAPLSILLAMVTLLQRRRVLNIWQTGEPALAVAVDAHRSGIAPRSKIVRFNLDEDEDPRIYTTLYPHHAGELDPGETFWVVMPKGAPERALVANLYV